MSTAFHKLNSGWNAEPNSPEPRVQWIGPDLILKFVLNSLQFPAYSEGDGGEIIFIDCSRYRLGSLNDEGWYRGQCRFGEVEHRWGEFYQINGDLRLKAVPDDWQIRVEPVADRSHFLFYFRDEDFECSARSWSFTVIKA